MVKPTIWTGESDPVLQANDPTVVGDEAVYSALRRERILWLKGEVRDEMANRLCGEMLLLSAEDPHKDITLYVNSPGGSVSAGMAIYDTMQFVQNDIVTVGLGMCRLDGPVPADCWCGRQALSPTPHMRVMMHQPLGGLGGSSSRWWPGRRSRCVIIKRQMAELIAHHTGQTVERILEDSDREKWFSAEEAREYGFVDHVVTSASEVVGEGGTA
jgi:ATP-dependent Clp protease protease subunit